MCEACAAEYHDPLDRRFHAQPIACPSVAPSYYLECHPQERAERASRRTSGHDAIAEAAALLRDGAILAIKGLGGYHLLATLVTRNRSKTCASASIGKNVPSR